MKKKILHLPMVALSLLLGMSLAACNNASESGSKSNTPATSQPAAEKINVTAAGNKTTLAVEETVQLSADKEGVSWESSDAGVASVNSAGLVTAVSAGEATIKAKKEGFQDGSITITVQRAAALKQLHFEDADHYAADGWWGTDDNGATPVYARSSGNASDEQCIAHFGNGDKETLTFTSSAAIKGELVITMAASNAIDDMSQVMSIKFNNAAVNIAEKGIEGGSSSDFQDFSLGELDIKSGDNVLEITFLEASAYPYLDDLNIYSKQQATIAVKAAPAKEEITVANAELSVEIGKTVQIEITKPTDKTGLAFFSDKETAATVDADGLVTGAGLGTAKITITKAGMLSTRVKVTVSEAVVEGQITVEAEDAEEIPDGFHQYTDNTQGISAGHSGGAYITGYDVAEECELVYAFTSPKAQTMTLVISGAPHYQMNEPFVFATDATILLNGTEVNPGDAQIEPGSTMGAKTINIAIGDVSVKEGNNDFVIQLHGKAPAFDCFKFIPKA